MSREYESVPRPEVESHYHIKDLILGQEKRTEDRKRHQDVEKNRDVFDKVVGGFKDRELLDFYCKTCRRDFAGRSQKQLDSWADIAYYKIKHTCGTWAIRHITDRERDPYFYNSRIIARQRGSHFTDLLQPFENNFNLIHGKK